MIKKTKLSIIITLSVSILLLSLPAYAEIKINNSKEFELTNNYNSLGDLPKWINPYPANRTYFNHGKLSFNVVWSKDNAPFVIKDSTGIYANKTMINTNHPIYNLTFTTKLNRVLQPAIPTNIWFEGNGKIHNQEWSNSAPIVVSISHGKYGYGLISSYLENYWEIGVGAVNDNGNTQTVKWRIDGTAYNGFEYTKQYSHSKSSVGSVDFQLHDKHPFLSNDTWNEIREQGGLIDNTTYSITIQFYYNITSPNNSVAKAQIIQDTSLYYLDSNNIAHVVDSISGERTIVEKMNLTFPFSDIGIRVYTKTFSGSWSSSVTPPDINTLSKHINTFTIETLQYKYATFERVNKSSNNTSSNTISNSMNGNMGYIVAILIGTGMVIGDAYIYKKYP